ncbi:MAG: primosomal protein N' [Flavobacteriaceae bacterium]|nr:primosomal protein N' [Flavobacteriaceae bacterium]MDG2314837.1 primosomal protein N' [Flavobacteriaceae bacterium]
MRYFADILLPLPLDNLFTYSISQSESKLLQNGMRVIIPFGKSKMLTGFVMNVHQNPPSTYQAKEIEFIIDESPLVNLVQLAHWKWISEYYLTPMGQVLKTALPSLFLLESETELEWISDDNLSKITNHSSREIAYLLQVEQRLSLQEAQKRMPRKSLLLAIQELLDHKIIALKEEVYQGFRPKTKNFLKLHQRFSSPEIMKDLQDLLLKKPLQKSVVETLAKLPLDSNITSKELQELSGVSSSTINTLLKKEILVRYSKIVDRFIFEGKTTQTQALSHAQNLAFQEIKESFNHKKVVLFQGITSSGKTEVYAHLIEEILAQNKQVLYLLPEIALTTQLVGRLQRYFGEQLVVFHSRYSQSERVEVWNKVAANDSKARIVLGARSSIFLPFVDLGLVIVDEEHESAFKQYESAPRYHARDSAIMLAHLHETKILLGSATPSLESYYNAQHNKYGCVTLSERYGKVIPPKVTLIDLKESYRKKQIKRHFSEELIAAIEQVLANKEQVILFQNRRGYAKFLECLSCGFVPQCPNCDVSLTYHSSDHQIKCHYCGYHTPYFSHCGACESSNVFSRGLGTQQIQEELAMMFPNTKVGRMDFDTTRKKNSYEQLIKGFENQEFQILIGTQMVTKGFDFQNVALVGVLNADGLLNFPDFRSHERCFQVLQQVAGRSGRSNKQGQVIIQTYSTTHPILIQVVKNHYNEMFESQLAQRELFRYPPFVKLIRIVLLHKDFQKVKEGAAWFATALKGGFQNHVLGPEAPLIERIRNQYQQQILIKIPQDFDLKKSKSFIKKIHKSFVSVGTFRSIKIQIDVDAY